VTWLGHSTTLLEIDGLRVLTDPVWGERVSPVSFAGPRRFHPTPVSIENLPPLDAVLVSHDHFDHLDHTTIRQLAKRETPFVTSLGVGAHLEAWGVAPERITELDWWESATLGGLRFHAAPARHFSGRGFGTTNGTLWSSWSIETDRHRVFFSGDTGLTPEFGDIGRRLGPFDLVMLEVGAFFLRTETELLLKSRRVVPGILSKRGFVFSFPTWLEAAGDLCGRARGRTGRVEIDSPRSVPGIR